jgi:hypothetical protein
MCNTLEDWESFPETRPARITITGVGEIEANAKRGLTVDDPFLNF